MKQHEHEDAVHLMRCANAFMIALIIVSLFFLALQDAYF
jgi:hypothetical protein